MDYSSKIMPFYMTYPIQDGDFYMEEACVLRDFDYCNQLYPLQAKKIRKGVAEIMDKMDYEGSLLYDEYPDKLQLYELGTSTMKILEKEDGLKDVNYELVQLILYYEMYKRRQERRKCFFRF